jgi:predicted nucleotidyltransferase
MNKAKHEVLKRLTDWATSTKDISCIVVAGSHARKDHQPDEFSDIDVVIFSSNVKFYERNFDWINQIGEPVLYYKDQLSRNITGRKVYFSNGVGLDIFFLDERAVYWSYLYAKASERKWLFAMVPGPVKKMMKAAVLFFAEYIRRGFYCLVDKGKFYDRLCYVDTRFKFRQEGFNREKLEHLINSFWRYALHTAINLQRREFWHAKITCDHGMKKTLLVLVEIYTRTIEGRDYDTWHHARFLERWAAPFIVEKLPLIYGHYEMEDAWKCMKETADLFSEITRRLTDHVTDLNLLNPEEYVRQWIEAMQVNERVLV